NGSAARQRRFGSAHRRRGVPAAATAAPAAPTRRRRGDGGQWLRFRIRLEASASIVAPQTPPNGRTAEAGRSGDERWGWLLPRHKRHPDHPDHAQPRLILNVAECTAAVATPGTRPPCAVGRTLLFPGLSGQRPAAIVRDRSSCDILTARCCAESSGIRRGADVAG